MGRTSPSPSRFFTPHYSHSLNFFSSITPFNQETFTLVFRRSLKTPKINDLLTRAPDPAMPPTTRLSPGGGYQKGYLHSTPLASHQDQPPAPRAGGVTRGLDPLPNEHVPLALAKSAPSHRHIVSPLRTIQSTHFTTPPRGRVSKGVLPTSPPINRVNPRAAQHQRTALLTYGGALAAHTNAVSKYYHGGPRGGRRWGSSPDSRPPSPRRGQYPPRVVSVDLTDTSLMLSPVPPGTPSQAIPHRRRSLVRHRHPDLGGPHLGAFSGSLFGAFHRRNHHLDSPQNQSRLTRMNRFGLIPQEHLFVEEHTLCSRVICPGLTWPVVDRYMVCLLEVNDD